MEMATIGGSQDERERWPQEYTTMPYTYTHMQSSSQLPDMGRWAVARTGGVAGAGGKDRSWYPGSLPGPCSGIGEQRTGQNCACNQFQVCAARGLFEKAIPLPHYPISPAHFHHPTNQPPPHCHLKSMQRCRRGRDFVAVVLFRLCRACHHIPHIQIWKAVVSGR